MGKLYALAQRNDALAEGLTRRMAYARWDGVVQKALFTPDQAREHFEWMNSFEVKPARHCWTRDIATGRFVSPK